MNFHISNTRMWNTPTKPTDMISGPPPLGPRFPPDQPRLGEPSIFPFDCRRPQPRTQHKSSLDSQNNPNQTLQQLTLDDTNSLFHDRDGLQQLSTRCSFVERSWRRRSFSSFQKIHQATQRVPRDPKARGA